MAPQEHEDLQVLKNCKGEVLQALAQIVIEIKDLCLEKEISNDDILLYWRSKVSNYSPEKKLIFDSPHQRLAFNKIFDKPIEDNCPVWSASNLGITLHRIWKQIFTYGFEDFCITAYAPVHDGILGTPELYSDWAMGRKKDGVKPAFFVEVKSPIKNVNLIR